MKRLALVTPWPPQHSGIADYAYDLAKILTTLGVEIVVYTTATFPENLAGVEICPVGDTTDFGELAHFDCVVYQLGNNTDFHLWMIPLLDSHPGIVHVHDLVMHHMAAWMTWLQGDTESYLALLHRWYGERGRTAGEQSLAQENYLWDSDKVAEYPLSEEYLQEAQGIVVHSKYALEHVRMTAPHVPSFQVPQLYDLQPRAGSTNTLETIVVLGGVDPQKRLDWILEALAFMQSSLQTSSKLRLLIAGSIDSRCKYLQDTARQLSGGNLEIEFLGRVSENYFSDLFHQASLCIALRYPSMGETSAIVSKAIQYGVPTVVNDIGWYSELPDQVVKKLPVDNCPKHLQALLEYLLEDASAYAAWSAHCQTFSREQFSIADYGNRYLDICLNPLGEEKLSDMFANVLADCGMTGDAEEDNLLQKIIEESYF